MIPGTDSLREAAATSPSTIALIDRPNDRRLSYGDLDRRVDVLAAGLRDVGVTSGDRVALEGAIHSDVVELVHAIGRCGACVAPIDPELSSTRLDRQIELLEPAEMIAMGEWGGGHETIDVDELHTRGARTVSNRQLESPQNDPGDIAAIVFTSGTTGNPNAVRLSAENLTASAIASAFRLGVHPDDRWLCCLAPHHMGGFAPIVRAVIYGTGLVLQPFEPDGLNESVSALRPTGISVVPVMLRRALELDVALDELRTVLVGGARTPPELVERALERGIAIYPSYGLTETSSQVATATPREVESDPTTVGHPLRWTRVSVVDEAGEPLEAGEEGQIVVSGATVTPGYLYERSGGCEFTEDGGLLTGDLGYVDESGLLFVTGRADDRIVTGGVTVDPRAIEGELRSHPDVDDAAVIGLPDAEWGERVGAVVEVARSDTIDSAQIADRLSSSLSAAERPRTVIVVESLPRTTSGTIDRDRLRELLGTEDSP